MSPPLMAVVVDSELDRARSTAGSLARSGFVTRIAKDERGLLVPEPELPSLVLLHAEPSAPLVQNVLRVLLRTPESARIPLVLLCQDRSEGVTAHQFRTGVVAMLPSPFAPASYPARLKAILSDLDERSGIAEGELPSLVRHVRRFLRSGALEVTMGGASGPARAVFAQGTLQSAEFGSLLGEDALAAMEGEAGTWTFAELPGEATEGSELFLGLEDVSEVAAPADGLGGTETQDAGPSEAEPTRLLLVDDDEALCRMFRGFLMRRGFDVTVARDGLEGFDAAVGASFDLMVADLNMPRLDGWGLLRKVRDDFRTRELPVALLSNQDSYRDSLEALDAGAQAYFSKATRLEALAGQLRILLEPRRRFRAALMDGAGTPLELGSLGSQWTLRELSAARATGRLEASDSWAVYALSLFQGNIIGVAAKTGTHQARGERAFNAFIASRAAKGRWLPGPADEAAQYLGPTEAMLERAVRVLNANALKAREALLVNPERLEVNEGLYRVYAANGPRSWQETARLLCEARLMPRDVLAQTDGSPLEVEEALRDLLRRGVISFSERPASS